MMIYPNMLLPIVSCPCPYVYLLVVKLTPLMSSIFMLDSLNDHVAWTLLRGFGSVASLPIIETLSNDLSAYIAMNVISITDGQLYMDTVLFGHAIFPAISIEKSVSRVGTKSLDVL